MSDRNDIEFLRFCEGVYAMGWLEDGYGILVIELDMVGWMWVV